MIPYIWDLAVRDGHLFALGYYAVTDIQVQHIDTVAFVEGCHGVAIDTGRGHMTHNGCITSVEIETIGLTFADGVIQLGHRNLTEFDVQVIDTVKAVLRL